MKKLEILLILLLSTSPVFVTADGKKKSSWSNLYIIIIYLSFFLLVALAAYVIRHCRHGFLGSTEEPAQLTRGMLSTDDIESLPSLRFSEIKVHKLAEQGQVECAVCLNEFNDQEMLRLLPDCLHVFHPDCITPWLKSHVTCPVCRATLEHRQGSSVSLSSILERISGPLSSEIYDHGDVVIDDHDHDHDPVVEGSSSSLQVNLDGVYAGLGRSYSTGDLPVQFADRFAEDNSSNNLSKLDGDVKSGERLSNVSRKSDSFVNYSSLIENEDMWSGRFIGSLYTVQYREINPAKNMLL